ncbi:toll/interleukin-1 receptor domain-containing protein [Sulfitobacter sp. 20_GPM-1509m]|uniref:toll/interleukin-1 receptor domain-containing protein n=1 Tax=Sulfitobacter sp. 20_GPM-1509m TaxID=1380367 RepID=UPI00048CF611|nr:toll/interleukin-1 receptor domain-containing protein [Sulfitobacter sp. 20_GPM-1509m]
MRRSEIQKILTMLIAVASAAAASFSLLAIENVSLSEFLFDDRQTLVMLLGVTSAIGAAFASALMLQVMRRNRLRMRARRAFIIYAHEDAELAQTITSALREGGIEPWLDIEQISAGEIWKDAISKGLEESAMAVVLLTPKTEKSDFAMSEIKAAIRNMEAADKVTSPVIPVLFEGASVPPQLAHIHYVDMTRDDAKHFLVKSVHRAMDRVVRETEKVGERG